MAAEKEQFSVGTIEKAEKLVAKESAIRQDSQHSDVWWTHSLREGVTKEYRVQVGPGNTWVTCTCTHGLNHMGQARCYHAAAVLQLIGEGSGA